MPTAVRSHAKINLGLGIAALFALLSTGCDRNDLFKLSGHDRVSLQRISTPQSEESLAISCAESIRQGKYEEVARQFDPGVVNAELNDRLVAITKAFPDREPVSVKTIDATKSGQGDAAITTIALEYEYAPAFKTTGQTAEVIPGGWVFVQSSIQTVHGSAVITGIRVQPSSESIESINAFTFANLGISQYAALLLALLVTAFTLYAVVSCLRAKIGGQKWLWLLLMLINVGNVDLNWTTGHWSFKTLSIHFGIPPFPANVTCTAYGPWMVVLTVPLGALVFLLLQSRLVSRGKTVAADSGPDQVAGPP